MSQSKNYLTIKLKPDNKLRIEALIEWLNISFHCLKDLQISKLSDLSDVQILEKILKEM